MTVITLGRKNIRKLITMMTKFANYLRDEENFSALKTRESAKIISLISVSQGPVSSLKVVIPTVYVGLLIFDFHVPVN